MLWDTHTQRHQVQSHRIYHKKKWLLILKVWSVGRGPATAFKTVLSAMKCCFGVSHSHCDPCCLNTIPPEPPSPIWSSFTEPRRTFQPFTSPGDSLFPQSLPLALSHSFSFLSFCVSPALFPSCRMILNWAAHNSAAKISRSQYSRPKHFK